MNGFTGRRFWLFLFLLGWLLGASAAAEPPEAGERREVLWSDLKPSKVATPSELQRLRQGQAEESYREYLRSKEKEAITSARPQSTPTSDELPEEMSLAEGFLWAGGVLFGGGFLFFGLFWLVHKASSMGSNVSAPHHVEKPTEIDHDKVRRFVNSPSPPPLDLGVTHDDRDDYDYSYDDSYGSYD